MLQGPEQTIARARELRSAMSLPEVLLWRALRSRPDALKFRRQHPSGRYVADFLCHEARLIVEIDGEAHSSPERHGKDVERDAWFASLGFDVLRLPARLVLKDIAAAVAAIVARAAPHTLPDQD